MRPIFGSAMSSYTDLTGYLFVTVFMALKAIGFFCEETLLPAHTKRSTFSRSSVGSIVSSALGSGSMFASLDYLIWQRQLISQGFRLGRGVRDGQELSSCGS
jgi:hypothetical protein